MFLAGFRCFGAVAAAAAASPSLGPAAGTGGGSEPPSGAAGCAPSCGGGSLTTRRAGRLLGVCVLHVTDGSGWLAARGACVAGSPVRLQASGNGARHRDASKRQCLLPQLPRRARHARPAQLHASDTHRIMGSRTKRNISSHGRADSIGIGWGKAEHQAAAVLWAEGGIPVPLQLPPPQGPVPAESVRRLRLRRRRHRPAERQRQAAPAPPLKFQST